jgi:transposase
MELATRNLNRGARPGRLTLSQRGCGLHRMRTVLHTIASRARSVAKVVLGEHRPDVWVSGRYAGQQELGKNSQVCPAHVLRDVQNAINSGDTVTAPKIRDHLIWAGKRRVELEDRTLAAYAAKPERRLDRLVTTPVAHPAALCGSTARRVRLNESEYWRGAKIQMQCFEKTPATALVGDWSVLFRRRPDGSVMIGTGLLDE